MAGCEARFIYSAGPHVGNAVPVGVGCDAEDVWGSKPMCDQTDVDINDWVSKWQLSENNPQASQDLPPYGPDSRTYDIFSTTCTMGSSGARYDTDDPTDPEFVFARHTDEDAFGMGGFLGAFKVITEDCDKYKLDAPAGYIYVDSPSEGEAAGLSTGICKLVTTQPPGVTPDYGTSIGSFGGCRYRYRKDWDHPKWGAPPYYPTNATEEAVYVHYPDWRDQFFNENNIPIRRMKCCIGIASDDYGEPSVENCPIDTTNLSHSPAAAWQAGSDSIDAYCSDSQVCKSGQTSHISRKNTPVNWCSWNILKDKNEYSDFDLVNYQTYLNLLQDPYCGAWITVDDVAADTDHPRKTALGQELSPFFTWISHQLTDISQTPPPDSRSDLLAPDQRDDTPSSLPLCLGVRRETCVDPALTEAVEACTATAGVNADACENTMRTTCEGRWYEDKELKEEVGNDNYNIQCTWDEENNVCGPAPLITLTADAATSHANACQPTANIDEQFLLQQTAGYTDETPQPFSPTTTLGKYLNLLSTKPVTYFLNYGGSGSAPDHARTNKQSFNNNMKIFCNRDDIFDFKDYTTEPNRAHNAAIEKQYNHLCACYWDKEKLNTPPNRMQNIYSRIKEITDPEGEMETANTESAQQLAEYVSTIDPTHDRDFKNECWYGPCIANYDSANKSALREPYGVLGCPPICTSFCYSSAILENKGTIRAETISVHADNTCENDCQHNNNQPLPSDDLALVSLLDITDAHNNSSASTTPSGSPAMHAPTPTSPAASLRSPEGADEDENTAIIIAIVLALLALAAAAWLWGRREASVKPKVEADLPVRSAQP